MGILFIILTFLKIDGLIIIFNKIDGLTFIFLLLFY